MPSSAQERPLKVFLCHASPDKPMALELHQRLLKEDWIAPWLDAARLLPGQHWTSVIKNALAESDSVIILVSKRSASREGFVQREMNYAWDRSLEKPRNAIYLIPLRLEDCEVPFDLRERQWADYFGDKKEETYRTLLQSLKMRREQVLTLEREEGPEFAIGERAPEPPVSNEVEGTPIALKPKTTGRAAYWIGGLAALVLGFILFSWMKNPPQPAEPTPLGAASQEIGADSYAVEPSLTPVSTSASTPIPLPAEITDSSGTSMLLVPEGDFEMGSQSGADDEAPVHAVYLDGYYIDKYEATNAMYRSCVEAGACKPPARADSRTRADYYGNPAFDSFPVVYVDWSMANAFCSWRDARLPTEAEWEKAARGAEENVFPWGEGIHCGLANYAACAGDTVAVGSYPAGASPYGAQDMLGNVWEWVHDWYGADYYSSLPSGGENPQGPATGEKRVMRGGSWFNNESFVTSMAMRWKDNPLLTMDDLGFRCARDAEAGIASETRTPPAADANATQTPAGGFELISVSAVAYRGGTAGAEIRAQPGMECALGFILPSGDLSQAPGTGPDVADENGHCSWAWEIARNTNPGWGSVYIEAGGESETYPIEIK